MMFCCSPHIATIAHNLHTKNQGFWFIESMTGLLWPCICALSCGSWVIYRVWNRNVTLTLILLMCCLCRLFLAFAVVSEFGLGRQVIVVVIF